MNTIIHLENILKSYFLGKNELQVLKGIDLDIEAGEFVAIMGPSGSGKSTFFNQIGALDVPTEGRVFFEGESLFDLPEAKQAWVRCNRIGYIFQTFNLIAVMSALQNVMLPMTFRGDSRKDAIEKATNILQRVGLGHRLHNKPFELSGGQQQRVAVARALANTPSVILADEPTGNLYTKTGEEIIELMKSLNSEKGVTIICSTHDDKMLAASDRVCWIRDGSLHKIGSSDEIKRDALKT
jgi:putative ABC transport system ATP-binding protein